MIGSAQPPHVCLRVECGWVGVVVEEEPRGTSFEAYPSSSRSAPTTVLGTTPTTCTWTV